MSDCEQEMCPFWTGEGCACAVIGIGDVPRAQARLEIGAATEADLDLLDGQVD